MLLASFHFHCPKFPKPQQEGWFVLLIEKSKDEINVLKRLAMDVDLSSSHHDHKKSNHNGSLSTFLSVTTPKEPGTYSYQVMLISEVYLDFMFEKEITLMIN